MLGREEALIAYYRRLVETAERHGRSDSLAEPFPYFALSPKIVAGGETLASFAWSDDLDAAREVLEALVESGPETTKKRPVAPGWPRDLVWEDQDQGWAIRIVSSGARTGFVEWDAEGPPPADGGWSVDAAVLARQAAEVLARLEAIHGRLTDGLGRDYWTYRPVTPPRRRGLLERALGMVRGSRAPHESP